MSNDFSKRASIGQAYNLAVAEAISKGRSDDVDYIFKLYYKHLKLAALVQKSDPNQLADIAGSPELIALFSKVEEELN